ncbi:MAG: hypothetical protein SGILL_010823, partial [Bacillariaceae sp.]
FATRAKRIEQKATIQTVQDKDETLLQTYRDEIEDLKQQLAEAKEQQRQLLALQTPHQQPLTSTTAVTTMTTPSLVNGDTESPTEEIEELVEAISKMEQLILKSRPHQHGNNPPVSKKLDDTLASLLQSDDEDDESEEEMLLDDHAVMVKAPQSLRMARSPEENAEDQLHSELSRIRGLLGSVLQKRGVVTSQSSAHTPEKDQVRKSLDYTTPKRVKQELDQSLEEELNAAMPFDELIESDDKSLEVESLRKQLEDYERTTNLRKADSSFLQAQLEEKDKLLEEVSNLLEAVEQRQAELEQENAKLKKEVEELRRVSL